MQVDLLVFLVAIGRPYGPLALDAALRVNLDLIRGTLFLIQLFLLDYGGTFIGCRAGFEAVPHGHIEEGRCLGLNRARIVKRILTPEMTMLVLPPAVNMVIVLLEETAVFSIIAVPDFTF